MPADKWTLVGGPMTELHSISHGLGTVRPTNDVDIVRHVETYAASRTRPSPANLWIPLRAHPGPSAGLFAGSSEPSAGSSAESSWSSGPGSVPRRFVGDLPDLLDGNPASGQASDEAGHVVASH